MAEKQFLGVLFQCCNTYVRIYRNKQGDAYEGRCPSCPRPMRIDIAPHATKQRFFTARPVLREPSRWRC